MTANKNLFADIWDPDSKQQAVAMLAAALGAGMNNWPILFYGSLLGCCRNGKIIPWDGDIDLCIDIDSNKEAMQQTLRDCGYEISPQETKHYFKVRYPGLVWPWVDVYYYRLTGNDVEFLNVDSSLFYKCHQSKAFPLTIAKFENLDVLVPVDPHIHLDRLYPDWRNIAESPLFDYRNAKFLEPHQQRVRVPIGEIQ